MYFGISSGDNNNTSINVSAPKKAIFPMLKVTLSTEKESKEKKKQNMEREEDEEETAWKRNKKKMKQQKGEEVWNTCD